MSSHSTLYNKLIDWHCIKHPTYALDNQPNDDSKPYLDALVENILLPIEKQFGEVTITYGFNSSRLNRFVQRTNSRDTGPKEDQHAALEYNLANRRICARDGASCDIAVKGYENRMHLVALFISEHLPFDRLYFYGSQSPLHISFGPNHSKYIQYRRTREDGRRVLGKVIKQQDALSYFSDPD
ncbi:hypothetical protein [Vibrio superstes]|uniref:Peptidase M15A C-terminal domain-containing protein n=1 Tax=Vibrio superstes NBRC 103154 TaxID=1219062 RepID=A0A511QQF4_9VIBR|nr:hypothetical protein [Vibrio superstes]GEM79584.1 hypothetical protein VSU01S_18290 [Vibrio superstes NBRC 103154]